MTTESVTRLIGLGQLAAAVALYAAAAFAPTSSLWAVMFATAVLNQVFGTLNLFAADE